MDEISKRLRETIEESGLSFRDLENLTGISRSTIQRYSTGSTQKMPLSSVKLLAKALKVAPEYLMGWTDEKKSINNLLSVKTKLVPLIGDIACGKPVYAAEKRGTCVITSDGINADFCLRAVGDSMIGARIHDGDIVFCVEQSSVDNGEIAAVIIDDEATLKRVYLERGKLVLAPENPAYPPLVYVGEELENVRIIGKAVAFQSHVK